MAAGEAPIPAVMDLVAMCAMVTPTSSMPKAVSKMVNANHFRASDSSAGDSITFELDMKGSPDSWSLKGW